MLYGSTGLAGGSDVTQTLILWRLKGESATMGCHHTKDASYYQMYWYRQLPGEGMKQIVYTTPTTEPEYGPDFSKDKFPANKSTPENGTLTVNTLVPEDNGMYFCAVSKHSDKDDLYSCTKTSVGLTVNSSEGPL